MWQHIMYLCVRCFKCREVCGLASQFIVNISPSFREFTAPLCHILPIHDVTINNNDLFVNFRRTFAFCIEKSYDGMHLAFGGTLDQRCHFKHISLKQSQFYHCQMSTVHRQRIKVVCSIATISIKKFPIGLHVMYLYFPDTRRIYHQRYIISSIDSNLK